MQNIRRFHGHGALKAILIIALVNRFVSHQEVAAEESESVAVGVVIIWPKASKSAAAGMCLLHHQCFLCTERTDDILTVCIFYHCYGLQ